ncbi:MAG TPA: hypothetical protein VD928_00095 [Candidatus Paceibacterota bacterium]|nr:hypothetical protein [Candidatus Paceibacterota bacterium]
MHHAYLHVGSASLLEELVRDARKRFGFKEEHDPDVQVRSFERFGIEEARELKASANLRSVSGRGLFILAASSLTSEAQQAILKLMEEPQKGLIFILLVPHGSLLGTLRSRLMPYPSPAIKSKISKQEFLGLSYKDRSAYITKLLKDDEAVRERVREFLLALEHDLYRYLRKGEKGAREGLEDIGKVRSYLNDRSPSIKMLLEHLAATLPKLS